MHRVTKLHSHYAVVTYGEPESRLPIFLKALPKLSYELVCQKVPLSLMSNVINNLRANTGNSSIQDAIKNKDLLVNSFIDGIFGYKISLEE